MARQVSRLKLVHGHLLCDKRASELALEELPKTLEANTLLANIQRAVDLEPCVARQAMD